jgi:hypothetical protein
MPCEIGNCGILRALLGDGNFLLTLLGMALLASGVFAIAQSISGQLLPHDVRALELTLMHSGERRGLSQSRQIKKAFVSDSGSVSVA